MDYIKLLVEDIHSVTMATINNEGKPITRIINLMLYDEEGIYFLTARGKNFYKELMDQEYISLTGLKGKVSFSLSGKVKNIGSHKLDEIFLKNTYMQSIYPEDTRKALDVFCLYEASGEYFDISDPAHIKRVPITINSKEHAAYYTITDQCIHCGKCETICPQRCIHNEVIDVSQCLHCGACLEICPVQAIEFKGVKKRRKEDVCLMNMCMIEDHEGHVLIQNKVNDSYTGITFPGGHVEKKEIFKDAMIREVKEETGLTIKNPYLCGLYHWYKHSIHNIILVYKASEYEGVLHSSDEGEVYWINKEDFLKQPLATGMEYVWDIVHKQHQECIMSNMGEHKRGDLF